MVVLNMTGVGFVIVMGYTHDRACSFPVMCDGQIVSGVLSAIGARSCVQLARSCLC